MAQRQDRDRERGRRFEPPGPTGVPEEGSLRPMWLKPPPRAKQPRLSWDQIIAGAAARNAGRAEAPAAPTASAAAVTPAGTDAEGASASTGKRRRRRRGRRGRGAAAGGEAGSEGGGAGSEGGEGSEGEEEGEGEAPPSAALAPGRAKVEGSTVPGRPRRRRGRRAAPRPTEPLAVAEVRPEVRPPSVPVEDDRPVIAIGPPRQRRRRAETGDAKGRSPRPHPPTPGGGVALPARGGSVAPVPPPPNAVHGASALDVRPIEPSDDANALVRHHLMALRVHPSVPAPTPAARAIRHLHGPRVPGAGEPLQPGKVRVIYRDGRELTPCDRKKAEQEVTLGRAKWVGASTIRLRYDPFRARRTRRRILERDGGVCAYCGALGDTIDHLTPWSLGGRTTMDNCVTSCAECNFRRGNRPVTEFVAQEGLTLRKLSNPVLVEYVRTARASVRKPPARRRARPQETDQAGGA